MGRLATVLAIVRTIRNGGNVTDIRANIGGNFNVTELHTSSPGDDSQPLPGDYAALLEVVGSGQGLVVGYMDPLNVGTAEPGGKRIYSRDSAGAVKAFVHLKADGSVLMINASGLISLSAGGDATINGVTIDTSGNITVPGGASISSPSVVANGLELAGHTHAVTTAPGTTGPNQ